MTNNGAIILVEDDKDDIEIISTIISETFSNHSLKVFQTLEKVFDFLKNGSDNPFIIICDNNWRNKNQNKFAELMATYPGLKLKSIPFVFYSAEPQDEMVIEAFENLNVQGYFQKGSTYEQIRKDLKTIISYWESSAMPANK